MSIVPFSGRDPGYSFVNSHSEVDDREALQKLNGHYIYGRPLKVPMATPKRGAGSSRSSWRPLGDDVSNQESNPFVFDRWTQYDTNKTWTALVNEGRRLFVGGTPRIPTQAMLNVELREPFKDYDVQSVSKMVSLYWIRKSDPGGPHYCFVDMATTQDADHAAVAINDSSC
jgi:RNA recognition motif-containing protein